MITHYKEMVVWKKAIQMVADIYKLTRTFPKEEIYGLTSQLRRAAVSVPSNIAEGHARGGRAEYKQFLIISRGSLAEVETQLIIAERLDYATQAQLAPIISLHEEVGKMLNALLKKLVPSP